MKNFDWDDLNFSIGGRNCALWPMELGGYCLICCGGLEIGMGRDSFA